MFDKDALQSHIVLIADVLRRHLVSVLPDTVLRAFADDTAAIIPDFLADGEADPRNITGIGI